MKIILKYKSASATDNGREIRHARRKNKHDNQSLFCGEKRLILHRERPLSIDGLHWLHQLIE